MPALNENDPRTVAWKLGCLGYKLRPHGQTDAYLWVKKWHAEHPKSGGPLVLNCHRRFGKSFLSILLGLERAISAPKQRVRIVTPTQKQGLGIFMEQWNTIVADAPGTITINVRDDEIRIFNANWKDADPRYDYSTIFIHGTEAGTAERMRGKGSDMLILDEARDMSELEYLIKSILSWHLMKRKKPLMIVISTPPRTADHYLTGTIIKEAVLHKRYFKLPISEDKDVHEEDLAFVRELCGSEDSVAWQREGECELLADPGALIIYEWQRYENSQTLKRLPNKYLCKTYERPSHYYPRTTIDAGFGDRNGVLFWFWDYKAGRMVILREIFTRGMNSAQLRDTVLIGEEEVFKGAVLRRDLIRDGDLTPQQCEDLRTLFGFRVDRVDIHDKMAAIDAANATVAAGNVVVQEECVELIHQLRNGAFKSEGSQQFIRSERMGHCDMVAAFVAAHRSVEWLRKWDPFPEEGTWVGDMFIPNDETADSDLALLSQKFYEV